MYAVGPDIKGWKERIPDPGETSGRQYCIGAEKRGSLRSDRVWSGQFKGKDYL